MVHFLKSDTASTFAYYSDKIFVPFVFHQLQDATRIDIVWDVYFSKVVQETREVAAFESAQAKIPKKREDFLRDARNKEELFYFITESLSHAAVPEGKAIFVTSG